MRDRRERDDGLRTHHKEAARRAILTVRAFDGDQFVLHGEHRHWVNEDYPHIKH